jgi:hypothetical protein
MKSIIAAGNRCFYSLGQRFRRRAMSKPVKIKIYKRMVKPVVEHEIEIWPMTHIDKKDLIHGTENIKKYIWSSSTTGMWRIKLIRNCGSYRDLNKVKKKKNIKKKRLEWIGFLVRLDNERVNKKISEIKPGERKRMGRLRWRWLADVKNGLQEMKFKL